MIHRERAKRRVGDDRTLVRPRHSVRVRLRSRTYRARFIAITAMLALAGQAVIALIAPAAEARSWHSVPAHVEPEGTTQHHVHNAADCPSCLAMQLTGLPQAAERPELVVHEAPIVPPVAILGVARATRVDPRHSRAPPPRPAPVR